MIAMCYYNLLNIIETLPNSTDPSRYTYCFMILFLFVSNMCNWQYLVVMQANPPDPKTFPFILLGNKIDIDGGNSRVVSWFLVQLGCINYRIFIWGSDIIYYRFLRKRRRNGVHQKGTYPTLRHQLKKITMSILHSYVLRRLL